MEATERLDDNQLEKRQIPDYCIGCGQSNGEGCSYEFGDCIKTDNPGWTV